MMEYSETRTSVEKLFIIIFKRSMNIALNSAIVRESITNAEIIAATLQLNAELEPEELKIIMKIGDSQERMIITGTAIDKYLLISFPTAFKSEISQKINDKGRII